MYITYINGFNTRHFIHSAMYFDAYNGQFKDYKFTLHHNHVMRFITKISF